MSLFSAAMALSLAACSGCSGGGGTDNPAPSGGGAAGGTAAAPGRELPTAEGNKAEGDTIKIGLISSLSGDNQPWGEDSKNGAQLAVDEFNAAGGVNGKMIELKVEDTASKPESGKSATEKLVGEDKVLAVIGEVASGITIPAAQVCQENSVPIVAVGATRVDITQKGGAIFRACFTDNFQGAAMAKFAYEDLKLRNVAVMTDRKLPYSTGLSDVFKEAFEFFGGKIATEEFYESGGNMDFKAQLTNIKSKNPDGMFCSGYFTEVGPIARQREQVGLNVPMFGGDGWDSTQLINSGGTGIQGQYFLNHYHNSEQRAEVQDFVKKFQAKYNHPPATAMGALGYDATNVVLTALKASGATDSKSLITAIAGVKDMKGVSGSITIGADGNAQKPALVLQVGKTEFKPVKQIPFFVFESKKK
ncbi:MAG: ABC transporter substrate-binding protein [Armatimonadetes bacterium]|nr:ABC transporter substrate-binding protein [Armatimonadota bacterium]